MSMKENKVEIRS